MFSEGWGCRCSDEHGEKIRVYGPSCFYFYIFIQLSFGHRTVDHDFPDATQPRLCVRLNESDTILSADGRVLMDPLYSQPSSSWEFFRPSIARQVYSQSQREIEY